MRPVQPDDLGQQVRVRASDFAPEVECRPRYRATDIGLSGNTSYPAATRACTHGPRSVSIPTFTNVAGADFDDEQAVQALQRRRALEMEEIGGGHGRRLGVRELPPGRAGVTFRRGRNTQCLENPADRGRADPVTGLQQLALDPLGPPARILAGEPSGQHGDPGADRWPPRPVRTGPLPGN